MVCWNTNIPSIRLYKISESIAWDPSLRSLLLKIEDGSKLFEYCFGQYYDDLDENDLTVDTLDRTLDCIRLVWDRNAGVPGKS